MAWKLGGNSPLFIQLADIIRADVLSGKYAPDEQIPPVRHLAFDASVNPNTMQKALVYLEEEGLLYAKGTAGRFVTSDAEVLRRASENYKLSLMRRLVSEAVIAGITKKELIEFIRSEETP